MGTEVKPRGGVLRWRQKGSIGKFNATNIPDHLRKRQRDGERKESLLVLRTGWGPKARTPQSTVSAGIGLRAKANAGQGRSRAGAAGVWASRRVGREGAVKLSDSSPRRAGSASRKSDRGRRGAGARSPAQAERDTGARRDRACGRRGTHPAGGGLRGGARRRVRTRGADAGAAACGTRPALGL